MPAGGANGDVGWVVLIPRLPSEPSRHRVAVWRELRRAGAIQLGQGAWALPADRSYADAISKLVDVIRRNDGDVLVLDAHANDQTTNDRMRSLYDDARRSEWSEFTSECGKCLAELQREIDNQKFTLAELDEEEQNVDRLRRWHRELRVRDLFDAVSTDETQQPLDACIAELEYFTSLVYAAVGLG
jgi:hypothetical protein